MSEYSLSAIKWNIPTFLVVTGASRGLGQTISIEFSKKICDGSCIMLIARDKTKLIITENIIKEYSRMKTHVVAIDLALPDTPSYEHILVKYLQQSRVNFQQAVLIHNAGSLGDISKTIANSNLSSSEIKDYFNVNLYSAMFLTSAFLKVFKAVQHKLIINISSLAAVVPFQGWHLYCTSKAARDMYFRVLAEEEKNTVTVLSYAPGPLVTDMLPQILQQALPDIQQKFHELQAQNRLLTCEYTVHRLIEILERSLFKSGDHVDVFDVNY